MAEAAFWGLVAGSSLVIGGILALTLRPSHLAVGLMLGFGSGVLISAVAYELVGDAFETSTGGEWVAAGLAVGALTYFAGARAINRRGGGARMRMHDAHKEGQQKAIVLGTVLDGIPEGIVLGMSFIGGGSLSVAIIAAVFLSNLPEAIGATPGLERGGMTRRSIILLWTAIMLVTMAASIAGFGLFDNASPDAVAFTQAFAGGALLTMLADTMMPEAFREGGDTVGLLTVLGFAIAFALSQIG